MPALIDTPRSVGGPYTHPSVSDATLVDLLGRVQLLEAYVRSSSTNVSSNSSEFSDHDQQHHHHIEYHRHRSPRPRMVKEVPPTTVTEVVPEQQPQQQQPQQQAKADVKAAAAVTSVAEIEDPKHVELAGKILDVVASYGTCEETVAGEPLQAKKTFLPVVIDAIKKGEAVKMVLPAFPMKSPNRSGKVLGSLPDLGEEIALSNLQSLCDSIRQVYEHGADCYITSDGLVYNDLLGLPDSDVWAYGEELRRLAEEKKLSNIKFLRLPDLLEVASRRSSDGACLPPTADSMSAEDKRMHHLVHAPCTRRELVYRYQPPGFDAEKAIKEDADTCLTYRGYLRFLKKDLEHQEHLRRDASTGQRLTAKKFSKVVASIAKRMIARGAAFAAAIRDTHGDCVRLSIHPTHAVTKFPVNLIPQAEGEFGPTPWHASVALNLDGSLVTGYAEEFAKTHDLVHRHGRPHHFREKSPLFDWSDSGLGDVDFEPNFPCGLIIRPAASSSDSSAAPPSARLIPMQKVRDLSVTMSPVVLRGFSDTLDEQLYTEKGAEAGELLPWSFGIIQKVKDAGITTKMVNNVTSNEAMPFHYDGVFKFSDREDPVTGEVTKVQLPPAFQFFSAHAVAPEGTGYTLFASSRLFWKHLAPKKYSLERFRKVRWGMNNEGFWDAKVKDLPLVIPHPVNNEPCIRWHEPWSSSQTKFSTCEVFINNDEPELVDVVTDLLYDYRVCARLTWHVGDWLVNDNTAMMHTRTGYTTGCDRELWRIHFD
ncbi:hypothetical protein N3K66_006169 [Trichothecium roseum]|uniref:Uncharacterized protein n=1 Tax=Trichothecium roseum TaxID=47278 RepID=A0ACC0UZW7_9HYPO|nr:hypothetical protein N3K66_006169 [Trichothecium roseum]